MNGFDRSRVEQAIAQLHDAPQMAYVVCTGAGAGVTQLLWLVPGCSRTLIASEFPYDAGAFANLIGRIPEQYCSAEAAIALAAAGYLKAQRFLVEQGKQATPIISLGLTAAVSTDRSRRGNDRVFIAVRTAAGSATISAVFERDQLTRQREGEICDLLALNCLLWASGIQQVPLLESNLISDEITGSGAVRPAPVTLGQNLAELPLLIDQEGRGVEIATLSPESHVIFPGSFNPLHFGHDLIAQAVAAMTGKQVVFEIAAANADKPGIDQEILAARALQFRGRWPVLLAANLPRFLDKARAYGGLSFILGLDTAVRLFDPKYFAGEAGRDAAVAELRDLGARFYVCNRGDGQDELESLVRDTRFAGLFVPLAMTIPVSSTDLRTAGSSI